MRLTRRSVLLGSAGVAAAMAIRPARSQAPTIKIGVLADFSGIYNDLLGLPGVECAKQAISEFAEKKPGFAVEIVYADHQNKADVGSAIARRWFDSEGVDMLIAGPNSSVGLAAAFIAREKNKACLGVAVTASDFTGKQCTPNNVNWTYDGYMLSKAVAAETVKGGGKSWCFVSSDNAFGNSLTQDTTAFVEQAGGRVLGNSKCPIGTADFSSVLLSAQASGAEVLGLSLGGADFPNCLKQAIEFGLTTKMKVASLVMFLSDIHATGLSTMQGLLFTNSFYWDLNDRTRAFTRRVLPKMGGTYPGMTHAGCYAVTTHYLKAAAALGVDAAKASGAAVVAKMKELPTDDDAFGPASIRLDGRALIRAYLLRVKEARASKASWDYCELISTTSPEDAARPLNQTGCTMIK